MATAWTPTKNPYVAASAQNAVLSDGNQTVWSAYIDNSDGNLKIIKSVDEGQNYGAAVTIATSGGGLNAIPLDIPLAYDPITRRLYLLYGKNFHVALSPAGTFLRYSDDQGATWSAEQTIDDGSTYDNTNGRFTRVGMTAFDGFVNIVFSTENSVTFKTELLALYRSTDSAATFAAKTMPWSASAEGDGTGQTRPVSQFDKQYIHLTWCDTAAYNGGTGGVTAGGDVFYSRSSDRGVTWTTAKIATAATLDATNKGAGRPTLWSSGGVLNLVMMAPFGNLINSNVWMMHSYDLGSTWGAPQKIATNNGSGGLSHPILTGKNGYLYSAWANQGTLKLQLSSSSDGGITWSAVTDLYTYGSAAGDAPWLVASNGLVHAWFFESTGGIGNLYIRNPFFWQTPDTTRVLFNPVGAGSTGPPPTGFTGSNGWCEGVGSAGDGLVTVSNTLTQNAGGGFRQGSWRTALLALQDHEVGVKFTADVSTWDVNGGISLYLRLQLPGTNTCGGYTMEYFKAGTFIIARGEFTPVLATGTALAFLANDYLFLQMVGTSLRCWYLPAGSSTWQLLLNAVDSQTKANGNVGLDVCATQATAFSALLGGTVADPTIPQGSQRRPVTAGLTSSPARWR